MHIGQFNAKGPNNGIEHWFDLIRDELIKQGHEVRVFWLKGNHPTKNDVKWMDFALFHFSQVALIYRRLGIPFCILPSANDCFPDNGATLKQAASHKNCLHKDTEILTESGWRHFWELREHDYIYTLNDKQEMELHKSYKIINYKYDGNLYRVANNSFDISTTPDHHILYFGGHKQDKLMQKTIEKLNNARIPRVGSWNGINIPKLRIKRKLYDTELFMKFMGWYLSEGHVTRFDYPKYKYKIFITQHNTKKLNMIEDICNKLFDEFTRTKNRINIIDNNLAEYLVGLGKSYEKYIPIDLKRLDKKYLRIFLDSYILGDGSIREYKYKNMTSIDKLYFTSSKKLADDIGELIFKCGKRPSFKFPRPSDYNKMISFDDGRYKIKHPCIKIRECNSNCFNYNKERHLRLEKYNDYVYCVEVPNNTIYIRHNGKCTWIGNCKFVTYQSFYHNKKYKEWDIPKPKVYVPMPVRTGLFKRQTLYNPSGGIVAGGRLIPKKGLDRLKGVENLTIFGNGQLMEDLKQKLEGVRFTGYLSSEELKDLFEKSSIYLFPAIVTPDNDSDGIPNTIKEAMLMELQVIASPIAGIPEIENISLLSDWTNINELLDDNIKQRNWKGKQEILRIYSPEICANKLYEAIATYG